jgi:hypothetical protein
MECKCKCKKDLVQANLKINKANKVINKILSQIQIESKYLLLTQISKQVEAYLIEIKNQLK